MHKITAWNNQKLQGLETNRILKTQKTQPNLDQNHPTSIEPLENKFRILKTQKKIFNCPFVWTLRGIRVSCDTGSGLKLRGILYFS